MTVSYLSCSEKEDFIWLYSNQNACIKIPPSRSKLPEPLIGTEMTSNFPSEVGIPPVD